MSYLRIIACLSLSAIAVFFAFMSATLPSELSLQVEDNREYYRQFQAAAEHIHRNGSLPKNDPDGFRAYPGATAIIGSSQDIPADCDAPFGKAAGDRVILSFWRGEWFECYAYPSGRTTLPMSVEAYLRSGLWVDIVIWGLIAIGAAAGAFKLRPKRFYASPGHR